ncbi:TetR/AcrR family transcriptional regulator [Streptomyces sp. AC512_CC834]|uniref:TetR/AcrR family transcriptional regulator n=1 Tax=Streptomyces sp. AC512_CC834 TaxID=2823691 RepID=UPI001C255A3C|nr:TetR/AcrR family transcriptional regulator [Streptomyces sp. AC512_CC834]
MLNAADDLLVERGFAALTIEGIAQRAGVAKQTIYRWWKSKVDILLDTLTDDAREALEWHVDAGVDAEEALTSQLRRVADFFQEPAGQVLQALLGHAQLNDDTATSLRTGFLREQRRRDAAGLRDLLAREEITVDDRGVDHLVDLALGPLYFRVLVFGAPIDKELVDSTARLTLALARELSAGDS